MSSNANFTMRMPNKVILDSNILPQAKGIKSTFNLSENLKTTIDFDNLYPVYWEELSPGDHFEVDIASVCRLMPTVAPIMDNVKLKYMAFWIPDRLLWKNFKNFMGEKVWQSDTNDFLVPQLSMKHTENKSCGLADYLNCPPTGDQVDYTVSALPFRAYNKIWNDWFRASQLQEPLAEFDGDTGCKNIKQETESLAAYKILKKGKPLDYFTSCLPYPQAGDPVMIPLGGNAPVFLKDNEKDYGLYNGTDSYNNPSFIRSISQTKQPVVSDDVSNVYADMSKVTGITVEQLRNAAALQVLLERDARAGERYADLVDIHYNVTCPDFLLGRSQFLGSCTSDIIINPIVQNSSTDSVSPQGNLTGIGVGQENSELCEISAMEHGIFMILCCATSDVTYQQGVPRKLNKLTRWDYMNPAFWNLGDQAVLNKEIYLSTDKAENEKVFGYQERYRELREGINKITGKMRSGTAESLDVWHLAEKFENMPKLNGTFIECKTPTDRILAAPSEPDIVLDIWFDIKATRPLPVTADPSLLAGRI